MEYEASRILEISLSKIDRRNTSRKQATTNSTLRRNLLVSSVLKAIKPDAVPAKDILMDYRETKVIDFDIDEANFERETGFLKSYYSKTIIGSGESVDVEWKPRVCSDDSDLVLKENTDCVMKAVSRHKEGNSDEATVARQDICVKEHSMLLETCNNTSSVLRYSSSLKRPRDSDFDMSHMPRPHKICRVINNESCEGDTQAVSRLETLFRDSFNEFRDTASFDRPFSFNVFPLVSVMAC